MPLHTYLFFKEWLLDHCQADWESHLCLVVISANCSWYFCVHIKHLISFYLLYLLKTHNSDHLPALKVEAFLSSSFLTRLADHVFRLLFVSFVALNFCFCGLLGASWASIYFYFDFLFCGVYCLCTWIVFWPHSFQIIKIQHNCFFFSTLTLWLGIGGLFMDSVGSILIRFAKLVFASSTHAEFMAVREIFFLQRPPLWLPHTFYARACIWIQRPTKCPWALQSTILIIFRFISNLLVFFFHFAWI